MPIGVWTANSLEPTHQQGQPLQPLEQMSGISAELRPWNILELSILLSGTSGFVEVARLRHNRGLHPRHFFDTSATLLPDRAETLVWISPPLAGHWWALS
jgi:hypothetical protein